MKSFRSHAIGVDQGEIVLFSDFEDGGEMWIGTGTRQSTNPVRFSEPFRNAPVVHLSMTMCDTDRLTNMRADLRAENITEAGFDVVFRTWSDSRVARIRAGWLAIGALTDSEDWDLY